MKVKLWSCSIRLALKVGLLILSIFIGRLAIAFAVFFFKLSSISTPPLYVVDNAAIIISLGLVCEWP